MTDETLLAHLAYRLGTGSEDLATEALAYILRLPEAARGMHAHAVKWCPDLRPVVRFRTQDWLAADEAIPDIVGITEDGATPLIVEAKFAAALTPNQPVTYLRRILGMEQSGLLLFLVPTLRATPIWAELRRRCAEEGLELTPSGGQRRGTYENVVVAVTTWTDLLEDVERAIIPPSEHRLTLSELEQLRGLTTRADRRVFQPFTSEFLGGNIGQRVMELDTLLNEAVDVLADDDLASTKGLSRTAGTGFFGRYLRVGGWECLLQVNFTRWGGQRSTPLWFQITDRRAAGHAAFREALEPLTNADPPRYLSDDGRHHIPVHISADVDRDAVFAEIDAQLREIHSLLASCPPPEAEAPV